MFDTLSIFPASFWAVIAVLIGGAIWAFGRIKDGTGLPVLAEAGWRLAVCTNKPAALARRVIAAVGRKDLFAAICGGDLRLEVECVDAALADLSDAWPARSAPAHE